MIKLEFMCMLSRLNFEKLHIKFILLFRMDTILLFTHQIHKEEKKTYKLYNMKCTISKKQTYIYWIHVKQSNARLESLQVSHIHTHSNTILIISL
jgi:hypothetical protein